ncbi:MAG: hypothetical protein NUV54_01235 [Candidatus Taylorbacteria bacterium]|nr:hypothetical protein [Candidatus Taylorbacteria bacterium]
MEQISFFLERFKTLGLDREFSVQAFVSAALKIAKVSVPPDMVTFKDGTFFVRVHPAIKSELYIKRPALLAELSETLGSREHRDIR